MTDSPRFETVKGEPDTAHRHYHGGRFVDFVLRLADRWRATRAGGGAGRVRTSGAIEIPRAPSGESRRAAQPASPMEAMDHILLEAYMPRDFVITSARTRRLQAGVLVGIVLILVAMLALEINSPGRTGGPQEARKSLPVTTGPLAGGQQPLTGSEWYRAEKCAGDYVCDEDGAGPAAAWWPQYPGTPPNHAIEVPPRISNEPGVRKPEGQPESGPSQVGVVERPSRVTDSGGTP